MKNIEHKNGKTSLYILVVFVSFTSFYLTVFLIIWRCRRKHKIDKMKMLKGTLVAFTYCELQRMTNNFTERLGRGGFGCVRKGCYLISLLLP